MRSKILTGAHIVCYINGKVFARVFDIEITSSTPIDEIYGLDDMEPAELAVTRTHTAFTMRLFRTAGDGGIEGAGITPLNSNLPRGKYFSVSLIDKLSDKSIFECEFCTVEAQSWKVAVKQFVVGSVSCKGIGWANEVRDSK